MKLDNIEGLLLAVSEHLNTFGSMRASLKLLDVIKDSDKSDGDIEELIEIITKESSERRCPFFVFKPETEQLHIPKRHIFSFCKGLVKNEIIINDNRDGSSTYKDNPYKNYRISYRTEEQRDADFDRLKNELM